MKITSSLKFLYISWRSGLLCAALGVIAQFFDIIFISRDGTKIDYKKTVAERLLQGNLHENCNDGKKTRGEFFYYGKS